ncbi:hypothetical protein T05_15957 [Trichinella murrelli]|uniref:Uncharacterized protein n=1 Tax=Trichinella murrelli TaxID=144512 RepID=A0A0V0SYV4_9BILA|nr:hypothetical protein T05_15957 [Trichinella murrelli]
MKKPHTSVTKCMTLRLLYTSFLTGLLTGSTLAQLFKGNVCHRDTPVAQSHP